MTLRAALATLATAATLFASPWAQAAEVDANADIELAVLNLINIERANNGLSAVLLDMSLDAAAEAQSLDMATTPCFQHASCDGTSALTRIRSFYNWTTSVGEIIAAGQTTPEAVVNAWMNSPGHRANILNGSFRVAGVALAYGSVSSPYRTYWTVDFGGLITPSTVAVPEPSTWALMGLGLLGMAWAARRNRRG